MPAFRSLVKQQITLSDVENGSCEDVFHIAYGADQRFSLGTAVSIVSVLEANRHILIHFHLFTDDANDAFIEKIRQLAAGYRFKLTLYFIDTKALNIFPVKAKWPCAIYFRIVAIDYLCGTVGHILYLDSDTICTGDIAPLQTMPPDDSIVAACLDVDDRLAAERAHALKTPEIAGRYFNSGVMLVNASQWQQAGISAKIVDTIKDPRIKDALVYYDQDLINVAVAGRVYLLAPGCNVQYSLNDEYKNIKTPIPDDTLFLHYIGATKPWHAWATACKNVAYFMNAKQRSPWHDVALIDPDKKVLWKHALKHAKHQRRKLLWLRYYARYLSFTLKSIRQALLPFQGNASGQPQRYKEVKQPR